MDVLRPPLLWIDSRCYRLNNVVETNEDYNSDMRSTREEFEDNDYVDDSTVVEIENKFMTTIEIPSSICGLVIGKGGANKKRLESETRTKITLPERDKEGETKIIGFCRADVISARNRIEILVNSARLKQRPTHFISLPLLSSDIKQGFAHFKTQVLQTCGTERGIQESLFQEPEKLHLTIGTLVLLNDSERQKASKVLTGCGKIINPILKGKRLLIEMSGIEYMNDDPSEVNVLYGKVSCVTEDVAHNALQQIADEIVKEFIREGLMSKSSENVKLHATLMNTTFARDQQNQTNFDTKQRRTFNAKKIIEQFKDVKFGECCVPALHLSQLHSKGADGYYNPTAKLYCN